MIETRCDFCGDTLGEDHSLTQTIEGPNGLRFDVGITCSKTPEPCGEDAYAVNRPTAVFGGLFYTATTHQPSPQLHACFGCAAHLVAVAYDQYIKKGVAK